MKQNQTSSINFKSVIKQIKLILSLCFFPILIASLLFNNAVSIPQKINSGSSTASFSAKIPTGHSNNLPDLFIEEESSEEDETCHSQSSSLTVNRFVFTFHERNFSSLVNNRFSHLLSAILQKADPPYFILYHSWKSELV